MDDDGGSARGTVESHEQKLLVVMVNTLAGPEVFDQLYQLANEQPTEFHLLMPVVRPDYGLTWTNAQALKDAKDRLEIMLEFMTRAGLSADGEVREEEPPEALDSVARGPAGPFDKIVAVWRENKYRWLYDQDREHFEQALGIPVESVRAAPPVPHSKIEDPDDLREMFEEYAKRYDWD